MERLYSAVIITFGGATITPTPNPVTPNSKGGFTASFIVPSSLSGSKTVLSTQGANFASKTFTVTPSTIPAIILNPTSGVNTSVNVIGSGFDPNAAATINFDGNPVDTNPINCNSDGEFSATFKVPSSSDRDYPVIVSQADNSASATFEVVSSFAPTGSSVSSFEASSNQSKITLFSTPSDQANGSVPLVTNNSSDAAESHITVTFENNTRPANRYSVQRTDITSTSPTIKKMNNTSLTGSTDNRSMRILPALLLPKLMTLQISRKVQKKVFPLVMLNLKIN